MRGFNINRECHTRIGVTRLCFPRKEVGRDLISGNSVRMYSPYKEYSGEISLRETRVTIRVKEIKRPDEFRNQNIIWLARENSTW